MAAVSHDVAVAWGRGAARCFRIECIAAEEDVLRLMPLPDSRMCPLSLSVMQIPVATADGCVYEQEQIERWIRACRDKRKPVTSPATGLKLTSSMLMPLSALHRTIESYLNHRPEIRELLIAQRSFEQTVQKLEGDLHEKAALQSSMEQDIITLQDQLRKSAEERKKADEALLNLNRMLGESRTTSEKLLSELADTRNASRAELCVLRHELNKLQAGRGEHHGTADRARQDAAGKISPGMEMGNAAATGAAVAEALLGEVGNHHSGARGHLPSPASTELVHTLPQEPGRREEVCESYMGLLSFACVCIILTLVALVFTSEQDKQCYQPTGAAISRPLLLPVQESTFSLGATSKIPLQHMNLQNRMFTGVPVHLGATLSTVPTSRSTFAQPSGMSTSEKHVMPSLQSRRFQMSTFSETTPEPAREEDQRVPLELSLDEMLSMLRVHGIGDQSGSWTTGDDFRGYINALRADPHLARVVEYSVRMVILSLTQRLRDAAEPLWRLMPDPQGSERLFITQEELEDVLQSVIGNIGDPTRLEQLHESIAVPSPLGPPSEFDL
eukprot:TRINITY_DN92668_c0_g1_i1.p1 TRINITY_DN92668_c0_g1~~TRINITY_DN92668_c0_g1_i1.p1  ORF type:complete len:557 (-),score=61.14 TRINITY_DN92668_c0_g1_i1:4-1674(-)